MWTIAKPELVQQRKDLDRTCNELERQLKQKAEQDEDLCEAGQALYFRDWALDAIMDTRPHTQIKKDDDGLHKAAIKLPREQSVLEPPRAGLWRLTNADGKTIKLFLWVPELGDGDKTQASNRVREQFIRYICRFMAEENSSEGGRQYSPGEAIQFVLQTEIMTNIDEVAFRSQTWNNHVYGGS